MRKFDIGGNEVFVFDDLTSIFKSDDDLFQFDLNRHWVTIQKFAIASNREVRLLWIADETIPSNQRLAWIVREYPMEFGPFFQTVTMERLELSSAARLALWIKAPTHDDIDPTMGDFLDNIPSA